jgi:branched-subunit amino acid aminotransferase/4-amino-4-deoxychorismate lyase
LADRGFTWGVTATDRCRTYNLQLFRWPEHLARFRRSCELCHIPQPIPDSELTLFAEHLIMENRGFVEPHGGELTVIVFATPGESSRNLGMLTEPLNGQAYHPLLARGAKLVTPPTPHVPNDCIPRQAKMRSRMHWWLAEQQVHEIDPDAIALLLDQGRVTETAAANFAIIRDGTVLTPARELVLDGISMRVVQEICGELHIPFAESSLTLDDCQTADEAFLTSTPYGIAPVSSINGQPIPWPGPVLLRIKDHWSRWLGVDIWRQILPGSSAC